MSFGPNDVRARIERTKDLKAEILRVMWVQVERVKSCGGGSGMVSGEGWKRKKGRHVSSSRQGGRGRDWLPTSDLSDNPP